MDEKEPQKKKPEPVDGPLLTERDKMKLERRKRKEERQREVIHGDQNEELRVIVWFDSTVHH